MTVSTPSLGTFHTLGVDIIELSKLTISNRMTKVGPHNVKDDKKHKMFSEVKLTTDVTTSF